MQQPGRSWPRPWHLPRDGATCRAKLDRLARIPDFLSVVRESGDGGVVFTDLPQLPAGASGKFILTLFAAVAELEAADQRRAGRPGGCQGSRVSLAIRA